MQHIIYADIIFLLNFCMDFLALFAAGKILGYKITTGRLLLSAAFGSLYSITTFLFKSSVIPDIVINVSVSIVMCFIAYKISNLISFTKIFLIFYFACFMLGGGIEALYYMSGVISDSLPMNNNIENLNISFHTVIILSAFCIILFIFGMKLMRRYSGVKRATIIIGFNGKETEVDVIVDSGNFLIDPISSLPVLVININNIINLFDNKMIDIFLNDSISFLSGHNNFESETIRKLKFRVIPVKTVNEKTLMAAFIPDYIKLKSHKKNKTDKEIKIKMNKVKDSKNKNNKKKEIQFYDLNAVVAVDSKTKNTYGFECGGIIPQTLIDF